MPPIIPFLAASPMVLARTAVELVLSVEHHLPKITPAVRSASPRRTESKQLENVERKGADEIASGGEKRPVEKAPK